jgi:hypothetical protein
LSVLPFTAFVCPSIYSFCLSFHLRLLSVLPFTACVTKHHTENYRSFNMNPTKNWGWTQVLRKGNAVPAPHEAPVMLIVLQKWSQHSRIINLSI